MVGLNWAVSWVTQGCDRPSDHMLLGNMEPGGLYCDHGTHLVATHGGLTCLPFVFLRRLAPWSSTRRLGTITEP